MRDDGSTDETLAAPSTGPKLAHGTTRGSDPTLGANQTRASLPEATAPPMAQDEPGLPVVDPSHYQIVRELARGGMGRILEARDLRLGRPIAIKEVLHADEGARARFDREVQITARLQHPSIVHVTEAGQWPSGQPFFAMKLIQGKPLDVQLAKAPTLAERLALLPAVIAATDALAYAHSRRVIHRDLKPANVLVGDYGETVVIDWGIAKDLTATEVVSLSPERPVEHSGAETVAGSVMGTPSYMPPEQANGDPVDERADVYALGALLYQLLAGVPPYLGRTTAEVLTKVLEQPPAPLHTLVPDAPVDLIAIVDKAMAREPAARFPTAHEMVLELKRFQQGQLVNSHDYTTWQLLRRWVVRNRAAVLVGICAMVALLGFGGFLLHRLIEEQQATEVEATTVRAQQDASTIREAQAALATDPTEAIAILKKLGPYSGEGRTARMVASEAAAAGVAHVLRGEGAITSLAFSPDGQTLASYENNTRKVRIWDLATWTGRVLGQATDDVLAIAYTADGLRMFDRRGQIWLWPTAGPPQRMRRLAELRWRSARWSPDGARLALEEEAEHGIATHVVDLGSEDRVLGSVHQPMWTDDGRAVLARTSMAVLRFELATGEQTVVLEKSSSSVYAVDATHLWVARDVVEPTIVRELRSGRRIDLGVPTAMLATLRSGGIVATSSEADVTSNVEALWSKGRHGELLIVDPTNTQRGDHAVLVSDGFPGHVTRLLGHTASVWSLAVSSTDTIATGDASGEIRVWTLPAVRREHHEASATFALPMRDNQLAISRLGPRLEVRDLVRGTHRTLEITEVAPGITRELGEGRTRMRIGTLVVTESVDAGSAEIVEMVRSADGLHVATLDTEGHAVVWDLVRGRGTLLADHVVHVAINSDGTRIATARYSDRPRRWVEEWDVATRTPRKLAEMIVLAMQYGPGDRLAVSTDVSDVYVFEAGHRPLGIELDRRYAIRAIAFSPDGRQLYLGSDNWEILVYGFEDRLLHKLRGHMGSLVTLAPSADGKRLFSAAADNTVRVWDLALGTSVALRGHQGIVTAIEPAADDTLLTSSLDGTARIWDLTTRFSRPLNGHTDRVLFAGQLPGGRLVTVDRAYQVAEFADALPSDPFLLHGWLDSATNLTK